MATSFGSTLGIFGIAAQQTGFLTDSISCDYPNDKKTVKNVTGDDTGSSYYNERIDITIDDQDSTQVMLVPGGMLVVHTVRSAVTKATPGRHDDEHYRPTMAFVPGDEVTQSNWINLQLHLREKAGAR